MKCINPGGFLKKIFIKVWNDYQFISIFIIGIVAASLIQYVLRGQISRDMENDFIIWYTNIKHSGFPILKAGFSNYPPLYLYILYIVSVIAPNLPVVSAVKLPSLISLWGIAYFSYKFVSEIYGNRWIRLLAFLIPLFTPTLLLNCAYWGQADCIYGVFLIGGIYFLAIKKELPAFIFLGLAFSLKFQTIFIFPLVLFLILKKEVSLRYILLIPLIYLILCIPMLLIGQPFSELFYLYLYQVNNMPEMVYNAPTVFTFIPPTDQIVFLKRAGIIVGFFSVLVSFILGFIKTGQRKLSLRDIIQFGLLSSTVMIFCLPHISERYFFVPEMFAIIYAFCFPRYFYISFSIILISTFTYVNQFFGGYLVITLPQLALAMLATICALVYHYITTPAVMPMKKVIE